MLSKIESKLKSTYKAVAIYRVPEPPDDAEPLNMHCIIGGMLFPAASEGRSIYDNRKINGCPGAVSGLGFGPEEDRDMLKTWFSCGTPDGRGSHFFKDRDIADTVLGQVNVYDAGDDCIVFEPLEKALGRNAPIQTVCFIVDPVRLSALMTLACYSRRESGPVVRMIHAFACEELYALPLEETESDDPKAVIGLTELGIRRFCPPEVMSFTVPYILFQRMERDADGSFLDQPLWDRALEYGSRN